MGPRAGDKRSQLFELNSAGLVALGWGKPDTFVCPLCVKVFTKDDLKPADALDAPKFRLTLAHIIPEALGGTLCTLACKDCNNGAGTSLEAALKEQFVAEDAFKGEGKLRARLSGDFGDVGVEVSVPSDGGQPWQLELVPKISNPAHLASLNNLLEGTEENPQAGPFCELRFEFEHQPGVTGAALYHAAYLMMFHYFGYPFVFSPLASQMRAQLREPDKNILPRYFPVPPEDWVAANVNAMQKHSVVLIQQPYVGGHVIMRFQPENGRARVIGVALPDFDGKSWPTRPAGRVRGAIVRIKADDENLPPWVPRRSRS
jgi:HNH endonuclease